jgi:site-specific DNA-methyltransferase (adenine-specific)
MGGGGSSAIPLYHRFIQQAKKMNPRFLTMIVPSRWFAGGKGLDEFRDEMLKDKRIRKLVDYPVASECFPGVQINGGVCYFLWDKDNPGLCTIHTHIGRNTSVTERPLLEPGLSTFIRLPEAISILRKVRTFEEPSFSSLVSPRDPFGLNYFEDNREIMFKKFNNQPTKDNIIIYAQGWMKNGISYVDKKFITTRKELVQKYKIYISKAYGASETYPHQILNKPFIGEPNTVCNMTYLTIGEYINKENAENVCAYIRTRFFRFLVSLLKNTQNAYRQVYSFVPMQDFSEPWTDEKLYAKYGITADEQAFIESMIRPMETQEEK